MNTNRDYLNYVTRHIEMLNQIMGQMEVLNQNMYNTYGRRQSQSGSQPNTTTRRTPNRPYSSLHSRDRNITPTRSMFSSNEASPLRNTNTTTTANNSNLTPLINNMINSLFWDPVHIRATEEEIEAATNSVSFADLPETSTTCPITMEPFTEESEITQITRCGHCFSTRHLRRWFQNHVTCPVCRHDIRQINGINSENDNTENNSNSRNSVSLNNTQPLTYQFDISMNSPALNNTSTDQTSLGNNGYTATYFNIPYPPPNRDSSL